MNIENIIEKVLNEDSGKWYEERYAYVHRGSGKDITIKYNKSALSSSEKISVFYYEGMDIQKHFFSNVEEAGKFIFDTFNIKLDKKIKEDKLKKLAYSTTVKAKNPKGY